MKTYKVRVYKVTSSYVDVAVLAEDDDEAIEMAEDIVIDGNAEPEIFIDEDIEDVEILAVVDSEGLLEE